jgi:hypothetical protein
VDDNNHSACVDAWMERVGNDLPAAQLLQAFEHGFAAVWRRAHQTLGDVTLTAIADRVLYTAAETFPFLSSLKIQPTGLECDGLHEHAGSLHRDQLASGLRFVLVEFLTVLGNLTAEILTPALHAQLSNAAPGERGPDEEESHGKPPNPESIGEGARS